MREGGRAVSETAPACPAGPSFPPFGHDFSEAKNKDSVSLLTSGGEEKAKKSVRDRSSREETKCSKRKPYDFYREDHISNKAWRPAHTSFSSTSLLLLKALDTLRGMNAKFVGFAKIQSTLNN